MQEEQPFSEKDIVKFLKNAIITNSYDEVTKLLAHVDILTIKDKAFFHNGIMLHIAALHSTRRMLEILKKKYIFCIAYFNMPLVTATNGYNFVRYHKMGIKFSEFDTSVTYPNSMIFSGEIISEKMLKQIPPENIKWLVKNNCVEDEYNVVIPDILGEIE